MSIFMPSFSLMYAWSFLSLGMIGVWLRCTDSKVSDALIDFTIYLTWLASLKIPVRLRCRSLLFLLINIFRPLRHCFGSMASIDILRYWSCLFLLRDLKRLSFCLARVLFQLMSRLRRSLLLRNMSQIASKPSSPKFCFGIRRDCSLLSPRFMACKIGAMVDKRDLQPTKAS